MQKGQLSIQFDDGSQKVIELDHVLVLNLPPGRARSLCFQENKGGRWTMVVTSETLDGKKLADEFLSARKVLP